MEKLELWVPAETSYRMIPARAETYRKAEAIEPGEQNSGISPRPRERPRFNETQEALTVREKYVTDGVSLKSRASFHRKISSRERTDTLQAEKGHFWGKDLYPEYI